MELYTDIDDCINMLENSNVAYYINEGEGGTKRLVCYSPYVTYDYKRGKEVVHCYVYNWVDTYDSNGRFISHTPFEGVILTELDKTL